MSDLVRLSFSLEKPLNDALEQLVQETGCANRSELIRNMIRARLVEQEWERDEEALATVTLVYNHHMRRLSERLTHVQHDHHGAILATTHCHLDHDLCAEMIMIRGPASEIRHIAEELRQQKGILHASLAMSSTGKKLV
ncbi:MAG: nickel-responsive transcriptional regulator NikR [Planctomycetes bacterium]|nr:nickel-responsive transcriptional regulator NikR [Planctomycetota bacterium]